MPSFALRLRDKHLQIRSAESRHADLHLQHRFKVNCGMAGHADQCADGLKEYPALSYAASFDNCYRRVTPVE
jgi:hypothetical protein